MSAEERLVRQSLRAMMEIIRPRLADAHLAGTEQEAPITHADVVSDCLERELYTLLRRFQQEQPFPEHLYLDMPPVGGRHVVGHFVYKGLAEPQTFYLDKKPKPEPDKPDGQPNP